MYSSLPKNEKTFYFTHEGSDTGFKYEGNFTVKCVLSIGDKRYMEMEKTRLMADYGNPSQGLAAYAMFLSNINARIIKAPQWWTDSHNGLDILDEDAIFAIYDEMMKIENDWKDSIKKKSESIAPSKEGESVNP